jgi:hypothetical protein
VAGLVLGLSSGGDNGVATAFAAGLVGALAGGLGAHIPTTAAAVSPGDLLVKDRRTFLGRHLGLRHHLAHRHAAARRR